MTHAVAMESSVGRNYWTTGRDKTRRRARAALERRVLLSVESSNESPSIDLEWQPSSYDVKQLVDILQQIVNGNRSFFSLACMERHQNLLQGRHSIRHVHQLFVSQPQFMETAMVRDKLVETNEYRVKLSSWFGCEGAQRWLESLGHQDSTATFTVLEFATWLHKYGIVGSLLRGAMNPCIRSTCPSEDDQQDSRQKQNDQELQALERLGKTLVVPHLFGTRVPLSLQTYLVQRVIELRRPGLAQPQLDGMPSSILVNNNKNPSKDVDVNKSQTFSCCHCQQQCSSVVQLCFGPPCYHVVCEVCFWKDLMQHLHERLGDVVPCTHCGVTKEQMMKPIESKDNIKQETGKGDKKVSRNTANDRLKRRDESLAKFRALPLDSMDLKRQPTKKKRLSERHMVASSWSEAVFPAIGKTQHVRMEKFWLNVERRSYAHVQACLEYGCDLNARNNYGQTALHIAAWKGDLRLLELLLYYGCDSNIQAHGGMTPLDIAKANRNEELMLLLKEYGDETSGLAVQAWERALQEALQVPISPELEVLISLDSSSPGAGSFYLDNAISRSAVDALIELWVSLPTETPSKKKVVPCSVRSYFCDAKSIISTMLVDSLESVALSGHGVGRGEGVHVFPHMRFLCYKESGASLAPHVDLPRTDADSGLRSTHLFLLYLTDCETGGETTLLDESDGCGDVGKESNRVIAQVKPKRGRLLLFPHNSLHEGETVVDVPKILIRGEVALPKSYH